MWSVGCILAELLGRRPLFPGKNFVHQLQLIFEVVGSPRAEEVDQVNNKQARKFLASIEGKRKVPFDRILALAVPPANAVLEALLLFKASERATAAELLEYAYFRNLSYASIPNADPPALFCDFSFERENLSVSALRGMIAQEVVEFRILSQQHSVKPGPKRVEDVRSLPPTGQSKMCRRGQQVKTSEKGTALERCSIYESDLGNPQPTPPTVFRSEKIEARLNKKATASRLQLKSFAAAPLRPPPPPSQQHKCAKARKKSTSKSDRISNGPPQHAVCICSTCSCDFFCRKFLRRKSASQRILFRVIKITCLDQCV